MVDDREQASLASLTFTWYELKSSSVLTSDQMEKNEYITISYSEPQAGKVRRSRIGIYNLATL